MKFLGFLKPPPPPPPLPPPPPPISATVIAATLYDKIVPSIFFPVSTLELWIAWIILGLTIWMWHFLWQRKPDALRREESQKCAAVLATMRAVLAFEESEQAKLVEKRSKVEASRLLSLLYDETHACRTLAWGISPDNEINACVEALYKKNAQAEFDTVCDLTRKARAPGAHKAAKDKDEQKQLASHESGEKLLAAIRAQKEVREKLGASFCVGDESRREAEALAKQVSHEQSKNVRVLRGLIKPLMPMIVYVMVLGMVQTAIRARFHQIGLWAAMVEAGGVNGDMQTAYRLLFELWFGHLLCHLIAIPNASYTKRAKSQFGNIIRNGVLSAMVRQDYEYFDKTPAGVLQDRLNKDCDELGENVIDFPKRRLENVVWIMANIWQVYTQAPAPFFWSGLAPVLVMCAFQYFTFRWIRRCNERARRVEEEGVSATSETLRQIKTVRQFSAEQQAAMGYARRNLSRQIMGERVFTQSRVIEHGCWLVFEAGICLTMVLGLPYVRSGEMAASELIDNFCKLNFNINFCLQEIITALPRAARLLEPMGRICDLLQGEPLLEPPAQPAYFECTDRASLEHVLLCCTAHVDDKRVPHVKLVTTPPASESRPSTGEASTEPEAGAELKFLATADFRFVTPNELLAGEATGHAQHMAPPAGLTYPLRAVFSNKERPARFEGKIEFKNVHFAYPTDLRRPVLNGISFVVQPGEKVALVGGTGCGKSTCMDLLQRLYDPAMGTILIDGTPLPELDVHYFRARVVKVDQNTVLFSSTIRENIVYGLDREVSDQEVIDACTEAQAWEFVNDKPDKLMTHLSSGGSNLSGGQKQRLAIARAIIRAPDVILLDEATSALDNENEAKVQKALDALARKGSALVIAHRLSTIRDSDQIIVLDKGVAVEIGTHDELLEKLWEGAPAGEDAAATSIAPFRAKTSKAEQGASSSLAPPSIAKMISSPALISPKQGTEGPMTYKRLWDAATGAADKMSLTSMAAKIEKMESELSALKTKHEAMARTKSALVHDYGQNTGSTRRSIVRPHAALTTLLIEKDDPSGQTVDTSKPQSPFRSSSAA